MDSRSVLVCARPSAPSTLISFKQIIRIQAASSEGSPLQRSDLVSVNIALQNGSIESHGEISEFYRNALGLFLLRPARKGASGVQFFYPEEILKQVSMGACAGIVPKPQLEVCSNASDLQQKLASLRGKKIQKLGDVLVDHGLISLGQLDEALTAQAGNRSVRLGEWLVQKGWVSVDDLQKSILRKMGYVTVDVERFPASPELLKALPYRDALSMGALPLCRVDGGVAVVIDNPLMFSLGGRLHHYFGAKIHHVIPSRHTTDFLIKRFYSNLDLAGPTWFD